MDHGAYEETGKVRKRNFIDCKNFFAFPALRHTA